MRSLPVLLLVCVQLTACSASPDSTPPQGSETGTTAPAPAVPPEPGTVTRGDASTNLDTTPLSAGDYAMYAAIMGGASAMLSTMSPADREALEFARKVDAGAASVTPSTQRLLDQARALQRKDEELARLQGIDARYLQVKAKVEAVIGPNAHPASADDPVAAENRRYLEAHRDNIERLQRIVRDPLSRPSGG